MISRVEALGFTGISMEEENAIEAVFDCVTKLPVTSEVIERAILLRRQWRMTLGDALIASTALVHNLPLATHNLHDFREIAGLALHDPLSP